MEGMLIKKFKIPILISLIIPLLISGPFLPDLIVSISTLIFLYFVFKKNDFYYLNIKPFIIFLLFYIFCVVSSLESENISFSLKSSLFYFRIGIFSCFVWYLIDHDKNILNNFYHILVICFSLLVVDGFYQYFTGFNLLGLKLSSTRISSFFGDELIMGSYLSRLFPLLFALFLVKNKKKFEVYFIGLLFISVDILIYMSGERSAFFFLNLSTLFIILLIKEYQIFRLITFIIAIICIIILSFNSSKLADRMFVSPAKDMGLLKSSKEPTIFTPQHDSLLRTAFKMFKEKPILGHGPKMFRLQCSDPKYLIDKNSCSTHPHNFYVQLLAETGFLGFLFLFSALIYIIYISFKQFKSIILKQKRPISDYQVCLLAGMLITVWPLTSNGNFFNNWLMIVYSLPIGFYLQSIYSKKNIFKKKSVN